MRSQINTPLKAQDPATRLIPRHRQNNYTFRYKRLTKNKLGLLKYKAELG